MNNFTDYKLKLFSHSIVPMFPLGQVVVIKSDNYFQFLIFNNKGKRIAYAWIKNLSLPTRSLLHKLNKVLGDRDSCIPPYSIASDIIKEIFDRLKSTSEQKNNKKIGIDAKVRLTDLTHLKPNNYTLLIFRKVNKDRKALLSIYPTGQVMIEKRDEGFHFLVFNKDGEKILDKSQNHFLSPKEEILIRLDEEIMLQQVQGLLERQPIRSEIASDLIQKIFESLKFKGSSAEYMLLMIRDIRASELPQLPRGKKEVQIVKYDKGFHFRIFNHVGIEIVSKSEDEILFLDDELRKQLQKEFDTQHICTDKSDNEEKEREKEKLIKAIFAGLGYTEPTDGIVNKSYPLFVANQVLTSRDLNDQAKYFEIEDLITRAKVIGVGIFNGLTVSEFSIGSGENDKLDTAKIDISAGTCITRDGSYLSLEAISLTYYKEHESDDESYSFLESILPTKSAQPVIELFNTKRNDRKSLLQIEQAKAILSNDRNSTPIEPQTLKPSPLTKTKFKEILKGKILVLVAQPSVRSSRTFLTYDPGRKYQDLLIRFFLIPYPDTTQDTDKAQLDDDRFLFLKQKLALNNFLTSEISLQQFGSRMSENSKIVKLSDITTCESLQNYYHEICTNAIEIIKDSFLQGVSQISSLADVFLEYDLALNLLQNAADLPIFLETWIETESLDIPILQYVYDYLRTLIAAYNELKDAIAKLTDYLPDATQQSFLMLGSFSLDSDQKDTELLLARSHFVCTTKESSTKQQFERAAHLYKRLLILCERDSFHLPSFTDAEKKITPSQNRAAPLSQQAIPCYLNDSKLGAYWNYDAENASQESRSDGYFSRDHVKNSRPPSSADEFYRIVGHLGKSPEKAIEDIKSNRELYNLAFDIIAVPLKSESPKRSSSQPNNPISDFELPFDRFASVYPGMEPLGGVPKSGTFILVYDNNNIEGDIVIADFSLPYFIGSYASPLRSPTSFNEPTLWRKITKFLTQPISFSNQKN